MNDALFQRLLHEEESPTLDFKKEQYRFVKATEEERSELLKDILGFANASRPSEAHILIGVEDVRGGRANVIGIPAADHLDDHSLQQFVNNLTNRPVRFHYEAFGFQGQQVGIICVEEQPRPVYLKRNYGKLKKTEVYVRRGSSIDPTKPAGPDEIALMGNTPGPQNAELAVEFADVKQDDSLGTHINWDVEFCEMPAEESIPDLVIKRQRHPTRNIDLTALQFDPLGRLNEGYYRELAIYEAARRLFRPVRLAVKNKGKVAANSVRVELTVPANTGVAVVAPSDLPNPPKRRNDLLAPAALKSIRPAFHRGAGQVSVDKDDKRFRVVIDWGDLQPGRCVLSGVFFVGTVADGDLMLKGQVFAQNLPQPIEFHLTVSVAVSRTQMTVAELTSLPESPGED